jgi:pyruvate dehydrogenase E1 component beta subunit
MSAVTMAQAVRDALADEMARDPRVWALGEDLARGGIFGQYAGLIERFGPQRIVSTPISEATIMGAGLGAALVGTRPVIEMRIADFALCAIDELVNQIAKVRYMFGGQARAPLVVRMPHGLWRNSAAQHTQCLEAWFVHVPGLVVLAPATPADAAGALRAAIRSDDPVVLFEPKNFWSHTGEVVDDVPLSFGVARVARMGDQVTLVTWSAAVPEAERAADASGLSVHVIDLRSLFPWDRDAVLASAARTGRVVIAAEAVTVGGFGAEIAATIAEALPGTRIARVGADRTPAPFAPSLEDAHRPDAARIGAALKRVMA